MKKDQVKVWKGIDQRKKEAEQNPKQGAFIRAGTQALTGNRKPRKK